jgi:hypothetical protein
MGEWGRKGIMDLFTMPSPDRKILDAGASRTDSG